MAASGLDFVAIDFETASSNPNSACQVAAVRVQDGHITDQCCWLLRPPRLYFSPRNIAVHGITAADVRDAPTIDRIWPELHALLDGTVVLAHNAQFDIRVLLYSLAAFDVACPTLPYSCTRMLARAAWPGRSRYGLKALADWLGIRFKHHDALEDAACCATIALRIAEHVGAVSMDQLEERLRVRRGLVSNGTLAGPRRLGAWRADCERSRHTPLDRRGTPARKQKLPAGAWHPAEILAAAGDSRPLAGRRVCLLGTLTGLSHSESQALIEQLGGQCVASVADRPHFVVVASPSLDTDDLASTANNQQVQLPPDLAGTVRVLSERQFRALLPGGRAVRGWD